jgi:Na+/pantothenate symporter
VNLMFLFLGAILMIYAQTKGITVNHTDDLFPTVAIKSLGAIAGIIFLIGLVSAAYPSADGALTSLTTSFCIDFLNFEKNTNLTEAQKRSIRYKVHLSIAALFFVVIILFQLIYDEAIIKKLFTIAGYTYGPLLGFYSFGLFTKWKVYDKGVPLVAVLSPLICYVLSVFSEKWFWGYKISFELLVLNGLLTFIGLILLSKKEVTSQ